jgi:hypothetical protein
MQKQLETVVPRKTFYERFVENIEDFVQNHQNITLGILLPTTMALLSMEGLRLNDSIDEDTRNRLILDRDRDLLLVCYVGF